MRPAPPQVVPLWVPLTTRVLQKPSTQGFQNKDAARKRQCSTSGSDHSDSTESLEEGHRFWFTTVVPLVKQGCEAKLGARREAAA